MPKRVNLIRTGAVSLRTEAPEHIRLSATVYAEPDTLMVYGNMLAHAGASRTIAGHVDVEVIGPDNTLLDAQHVPYAQAYPLRRATMVHQATFRANFSGVPSQDVVIILRHHPDVHTEGHEEGT